MKKLVCLVLVLLLSACASTVRIAGEQVVRERLSLTVDDAWNMVKIPGGEQPYDAWTQEGLPLDHLRFWVGIADGQPLMKPLPKASGAVEAPRVPTFKRDMQAEQLVKLFETLYAADGSLVSLSRVEPAVFAGAKGVRFEFTVINKSNEVNNKGVGWVAVQNGTLFASTFIAPRLHFFDRLYPRAEAVIRTAKIKS